MELADIENRPPIIAVSSQLMYLEMADEMGAEATLLKPVFPEQLSETLAKLQL